MSATHFHCVVFPISLSKENAQQSLICYICLAELKKKMDFLFGITSFDCRVATNAASRSILEHQQSKHTNHLHNTSQPNVVSGRDLICRQAVRKETSRHAPTSVSVQPVKQELSFHPIFKILNIFIDPFFLTCRPLGHAAQTIVCTVSHTAKTMLVSTRQAVAICIHLHTYYTARVCVCVCVLYLTCHPSLFLSL